METPTDTRNWRQVIDEAEMRGEFTLGEQARAGDWFSCACGELHPAIARDAHIGAPYDDQLHELGGFFCTAVARDYFTYARQILHSIEAREAELLKEMGVRP